MSNHKYLTEERINVLEVDKIVNNILEYKNAKILDFGCGPGLFIGRLQEVGFNQLHGFDIDAESIKYCQDKYPNHQFYHQIPNDVFEMILMVNVYHKLQDRTNFIDSLLSNLSPDGELVIVDFYKNELPFGPSIDMKLEPDTVIEELPMLKVIDKIKINKHIYILKFRKVI